MIRATRFISFILLVVIVPGCLSSQDRPAPEITGSDSEDRPLRLSEFRGKVVLLDFWRDG